jgi:hypothetical protein
MTYDGSAMTSFEEDLRQADARRDAQRDADARVVSEADALAVGERDDVNRERDVTRRRGSLPGQVGPRRLSGRYLPLRRA